MTTPPSRLLACLLALAIAIPAAVRADTAPATAPAPAPEQPIKITHGPYLQNVGEDGATIVWLTNKTAVSWVELAPDDGAPFYHAERPRFYAAKIGIKTEGTLHTGTLKELKPGVKYRYRVYSQEVLKHKGWHVHYGDIAASDVYRRKPFGFTTNDRGKPEITFSVVNDIHGDNEMLGQLLGKAEPAKNDLVIFNGDMVSTINSEDNIFNGFMDKSVELFASETPMYYARGNHETRGSHAARFQEYFTPARPALYYMFRHGPVCFVILDGGEDKPDSDLEYSGITDYDAYRTEEAKWLAGVVKEKDFTGAPFKVVICHIPPSDGWHGDVEIMEKFVPILNDAGVDIMLSGHTHRHSKRPPNGQVKFPVLVNSNTAVLKARATARELQIEAISNTGASVDSITLTK